MTYNTQLHEHAVIIYVPVNLVAASDEIVAQMTSDEPRATGNEHAVGVCPRLCLDKGTIRLLRTDERTPS